MEQLKKYWNVGFGARLLLFVLSASLMLIVAGGIGVVIMMAMGQTTASLRMSQVIQAVLLFICPPVITAVIACRRPAQLLLLQRPGALINYVMVLVTLVVALPWMNYLVALNESLSLPEALAPLERAMKMMEDASAGTVNLILGGDTVGDLIMGLLVVAVAAGVGEEFFFRGGLQQLLLTGPFKRYPHVAIWSTAVVFSAIHFQFYGFIPRLLLGAFLGYLAWWSGTIWLPVVAHTLNNAMVVASSWAVRRGLITSDIDNLYTHPSSAVDIITIIASVILTVGAIYLLMKLIRRRKAPDPSTLD